MDNRDYISSLQVKTLTRGCLNVNEAIQAVSQPKEHDDLIEVSFDAATNFDLRINPIEVPVRDFNRDDNLYHVQIIRVF